MKCEMPEKDQFNAVSRVDDVEPGTLQPLWSTSHSGTEQPYGTTEYALFTSVEHECHPRAPKSSWMSWFEVNCSQSPATDQKASKLASVQDDADFALHHQEHDYAHHKHYLHQHHLNRFDVNSHECESSRASRLSTDSTTGAHFSNDYPHPHYRFSHHHALCRFGAGDALTPDDSFHGMVSAVKSGHKLRDSSDGDVRQKLTTMNLRDANLDTESEGAWCQLRLRVLSWLDGVQPDTGLKEDESNCLASATDV